MGNRDFCKRHQSVLFAAAVLSSCRPNSISECYEADRISSDAEPSIDFIDLEQGKVVSPWKFEVRNVDKLLNHSSLDGAVILLFIDNSIHETGFMIAAWQKRVVHYATIKLPAGEYTAILRLADPETQGLLGVESPPRILSVVQRKGSHLTRKGALNSKVETEGFLSLVLHATTRDIDVIETLATAWKGPLSIAIFLNYLDLDNEESILSSIEAMHTRVEERAASALTITFLSAATCESSIRFCTAEYPYIDLINLALEYVNTDLLLFITTKDFLSLSIIQASLDPHWIRRCTEASNEGVALIVPLLEITGTDSRKAPAVSDHPDLLDFEEMRDLYAKVLDPAQLNHSNNTNYVLIRVFDPEHTDTAGPYLLATLPVHNLGRGGVHGRPRPCDGRSAALVAGTVAARRPCAGGLRGPHGGAHRRGARAAAAAESGAADVIRVGNAGGRGEVRRRRAGVLRLVGGRRHVRSPAVGVPPPEERPRDRITGAPEQRLWINQRPRVPVLSSLAALPWSRLPPRSPARSSGRRTAPGRAALHPRRHRGDAGYGTRRGDGRGRGVRAAGEGGGAGRGDARGRGRRGAGGGT